MIGYLYAWQRISDIVRSIKLVPVPLDCLNKLSLIFYYIFIRVESRTNNTHATIL